MNMSLQLVEAPPQLDVVPVLGVRVGLNSQMGVVSLMMTWTVEMMTLIMRMVMMGMMSGMIMGMVTS